MSGFGFGGSGVRFRVSGVGFPGLGTYWLRTKGVDSIMNLILSQGFRVWGLGFRMWGIGFRVEGLGLRI